MAIEIPIGAWISLRNSRASLVGEFTGGKLFGLKFHPDFQTNSELAQRARVMGLNNRNSRRARPKLC